MVSFDFNPGHKRTNSGLNEYILGVIAKNEKKYNIKPFTEEGTRKPSLDASLRFNHLIEELHGKTGQQVVVLIDEYDKPLLDLLGTDKPADNEQLKANRELLRNFFSTFKATDQHLRFVMLTGVTKFSQVTMFSGFNQPDDISLDQDYDTLLGITEEELYSTFADGISELAAAENKTEEQTKERMKMRYDGYHFSERMKDVYNPFSILNALKKKKQRDYWFDSGTPEYVVRLMASTHENVMKYTNEEHQLDEFMKYKADTARPLPMLFQAGYLTIKGYDPDWDTYRLDFPNQEVKRGFITLLANDYLEPKENAEGWVKKMLKAMQTGDTELVRRLFTSFLAETPYSMRPKKDLKDRELYFHYTFYLLMRLISCYTVYTEKQLSEGRADCIVETPKYIYIFEFKLDGTAAEALQQIEDRGYAKAYESDGRMIYKIGASFSSKTGTVEEWEVIH